MKRSPEPDDSTASNTDGPGPIDPVLPPNQRAEVALFMLPASALRGGLVVDVHDAGRLHFDSRDALANEAGGHAPRSSGWFQAGTGWPAVTPPPPAPPPPPPLEAPVKARDASADGLSLSDAVAAALREPADDVEPAVSAPLVPPESAAPATPLPVADVKESAQAPSHAVADAVEPAPVHPASELEAFPAEPLYQGVVAEPTVSELDAFPSESSVPPAAVTPLPPPDVGSAPPAAAEFEFVAVDSSADWPVGETASESDAAEVIPAVAETTESLEELVARAAAAMPAGPSRLSPWFAPPESERPPEWDVEADPFTNAWEAPPADELRPASTAADTSLHDAFASSAPAQTSPVIPSSVARAVERPAGGAGLPAVVAADQTAASPSISRGGLALAATLVLISGLVAFGLFGSSSPSDAPNPVASVEPARDRTPAATPAAPVQPEESRAPGQPPARPAAPPMPSSTANGTSAAAPATRPPSGESPNGRPNSAQPASPGRTDADSTAARNAADRSRPEAPAPALTARSLPPPPPSSDATGSRGAGTQPADDRPQTVVAGRGTASSEREPAASTGGATTSPATPPPARDTDVPGAVASAGRVAEPPAPAAGRPEASTSADTIVPPAEAPRSEARGTAVVIPEPEPIRIPPPPPDARPAAAPPRATATAAASEASAGDGIADALKRLQAAYERRDARLAKAIWPTVDERALARAFGGLRSQSVTFDNCRLNVSGPAGDVECRGVTTYVPLVGSQDPRRESRQWKFRVEKGGEGWLITSAAAR